MWESLNIIFKKKKRTDEVELNLAFINSFIKWNLLFYSTKEIIASLQFQLILY